MEKLETSYTVSGNLKYCSCFGKQSGSSSKAKHRITYDPEIPLLGILPRKIKTCDYTKTFTQMFIAMLFLIAKKRK